MEKILFKILSLAKIAKGMYVPGMEGCGGTMENLWGSQTRVNLVRKVTW